MALFHHTVIVVGLSIFVVIFACAWFAKRAYRSASKNQNSLVGARGRAIENFSRLGMIQVQGETWRASLVSGVIAKDETVIVRRILDKLTLEVEKE